MTTSYSQNASTYNLASDFGDNYPTCQVIGTDISPIQPGWVPPNVKLYVSPTGYQAGPALRG